MEQETSLALQTVPCIHPSVDCQLQLEEAASDDTAQTSRLLADIRALIEKRDSTSFCCCKCHSSSKRLSRVASHRLDSEREASVRCWLSLG